MLAAVLSAFGISAAEYPHQHVNLSLFYPISTNQNPDISTNFRLNLIYSIAGSVKGADINGVAGRVSREMSGIQLNGVYSHVDGEFKGAAVTGLVNYAGSDVLGVQYAGMVNYVRGNLTGIQFADLFNYVEGDLVGAQTTPLFNINDGNVKYLQFAAIANAVGGDFTGAQLSGGLNYVNVNMWGVQFGLFSYARFFRGVQLYGLNVADRLEGVQIGVVNYANRNNGLAVGVINIAGNGDADWVTFGSSLGAVNTGLRTSLRGFYSMFTLGVGDLMDNRKDTAFASWHYGYAIPVAAKWSIDADIGYLHIMPSSSSDPSVNDRMHFAIQVRLMGEVRVSEKTRIFAGTGLSTVVSEYSSDAPADTDPLIVAGVSLY
jgi:hypothetical protein